MKDHWKEHLQIDVTLYELPKDERAAAVAAKTPEKPGTKPTTPAKSGKAVRGFQEHNLLDAQDGRGSAHALGRGSPRPKAC